jgi:hypothetical protein
MRRLLPVPLALLIEHPREAGEWVACVINTCRFEFSVSTGMFRGRRLLVGEDAIDPRLAYADAAI